MKQDSSGCAEGQLFSSSFIFTHLPLFANLLITGQLYSNCHPPSSEFLQLCTFPEIHIARFWGKNHFTVYIEKHALHPTAAVLASGERDITLPKITRITTGTICHNFVSVVTTSSSMSQRRLRCHNFILSQLYANCSTPPNGITTPSGRLLHHLGDRYVINDRYVNERLLRHLRVHNPHFS